MDMWNLKQTWKKAKEKWSHMIEEIQNLRSSQEGRTHRIFSNGSYQSPWRMGDAGDVRVVVTQIADELDCIDELVLENELTIYRLAGYPIKVAPQDKEKRVCSSSVGDRGFSKWAISKANNVLFATKVP